MKENAAAIVIVGAGIVGASIAYHLAARGCRDVVILEKNEREFAGSTARSVGGVRHQFASRVNIELSLYSIERLRHFAEEVGGDIELKQPGYLFLISDETMWKRYQANANLQTGLGVCAQKLTPDEALRLMPYARVDDLCGAVFCADDGYCDPNGVAAGYLSAALRLGVQLRRSTPVVGIRKSEGRVTAVETSSGTLDCEIVINAAGPWAGQVGALAGLQIPVQPYRRCIYMTGPMPHVPMIPFTFDVVSGFYLRKEGDKILFGLSNEQEPSSENVSVDWDWLEVVLERGVSRFPFLEQVGIAQKNSWAGLYEITPDHLPVLGRHPELSNYVDASGFSGHGVMHSPATGMLIAEEVLDGRAYTIDIDELRITRFKDRALHAEAYVF